VERLKERLQDEGFIDHMPDIGQATRVIEELHEKVEGELRADLQEGLQVELDGIRNRPEWEGLDDEAKARVLQPFASIRRKVEEGTGRLPELASDIKALPTLRADAHATLIEMSQPPGEKEPRVQRIRASRYAAGGFRTDEEVTEALDALGTACREAIGRGETVVLE